MNGISSFGEKGIYLVKLTEMRRHLKDVGPLDSDGRSVIPPRGEPPVGLTQIFPGRRTPSGRTSARFASAWRKETYTRDCGTATMLRRGATWLENDGVNFAATLCGAIVAALAASIA